MVGESRAIGTYADAEMRAAKFGQASATAYRASARQRIDQSIMAFSAGRVAEVTSAGLLSPASATEDVPRSTGASTRSRRALEALPPGSRRRT